MAGRVDKPCDMVHPHSTECTTPHHRWQTTGGEECHEHGDYVPDVRLLNEAVEWLHVHVASVATDTHTLEGRLFRKSHFRMGVPSIRNCSISFLILGGN